MTGSVIRLIRRVIFLGVTLTIFPAWGALTLDEVLDSVNRSYPLLTAAQKDVERAEADLLSNRGHFDPVLKANTQNSFLGYYRNSYFDLTLEQPTPVWGTKIYGGWRTGQGNFPLYEGKLATFTGGEIRGGIEVPLLRNGEIDERRARSNLPKKGLRSPRPPILFRK
jgi:hypothetical protein